MSKRMMLLFAVAAIFSVVLWSGTSGASVIGTAHEVSANTEGGGVCGSCHIPHGGGAARLWPSTAGSVTTVGVVAPLCSSCHSSTGGYQAAMSAAFSDAYVYGAGSHGQLMDQEPTSTVTSTAPAGSGLEYADGTGVFECTTCHNVHDDQTNRPFLRDSLNALCARCHTNRHYVDGTLSEGGSVTPGAWDANADGSASGAGNPGSHPVGDDITGDVYGGGSVISIPAQMAVVINATAGAWTLGGKLTDGTASGGVTCVTCHAVHGIHQDGDDAGNTVTDLTPTTNFLAIDQNSVTLGGRSVANGSGSYNPLCEGCHGVGNDPTGYTGSFNVNPGGATTFSHPIDDNGAVNDAGVTAFPANWPVGGSAGNGPTSGIAGGGTYHDPIAICESCHQPHPTAELAAARADVLVGAAAYILRDDAATVCNNCHDTTLTGHHPVGATYTGDGASYLANVVTGSNTLSCSQCHGGNGAHNWSEPSAAGLDANWLPADNGRSTTQATDMINANMSITCMDCHYGMDGDAASLSPTLGTSATVTLSSGFDTLDNSMGTHYIGLIGVNAAYEGDGSGPDTNGNTWPAPNLNMFDNASTWSSQGIPGGATGWSRFGGTTGNEVLVCESCHELEPDKNIDTHLLLGTFNDGENGTTSGMAGDVAGRDEFCEACHGVPNGTHQVTGMNISRTGATLQTSDTSVDWLRGASGNLVPLGNATVNAASDELSCDSCHQVHDANTNSYTFMLDAPASVTFPTAGAQTTVGAPSGTGADGATTTYTNPEYATTTANGRGGDFTGFCDQCHRYAFD